MARVARFVPPIVSQPLSSFGEETCAVALSPDGKTILLGGSFSLELVDSTSGSVVRSFRPDDGALWAARFTPDGRRILGGIGDRLIVWDTKGKIAHKMATNGIVRRISLSRDGARAATSTWEKDVRLWNVATGKELGGFTMEKSVVNGVALSPKADVVACAGSDGFVRLIKPASGDVVKSVAGKGWIDVIERSDDGRFFATAGREAQVVLWSWKGDKLRTLTDMTSAITVLGVSPDGRWVAACGKKAAPLVWSTETGKVVAALEGHEKVTALSFSFDGRTIVTAGPPCVRVWQTPE
jgi:WD40 repeat protein